VKDTSFVATVSTRDRLSVDNETRDRPSPNLRQDVVKLKEVSAEPKTSRDSSSVMRSVNLISWVGHVITSYSPLGFWLWLLVSFKNI
jgi:hypothetical protein